MNKKNLQKNHYWKAFDRYEMNLLCIKKSKKQYTTIGLIAGFYLARRKSEKKQNLEETTSILSWLLQMYQKTKLLKLEMLEKVPQIQTENAKNSKKFRFLKFPCTFCLFFE